MSPLGSRPGVLVVLLVRLRPLLGWAGAAVGSGCRALAGKLCAVEWASRWARPSESQAHPDESHLDRAHLDQMHPDEMRLYEIHADDLHSDETQLGQAHDYEGHPERDPPESGFTHDDEINADAAREDTNPEVGSRAIRRVLPDGPRVTSGGILALPVVVALREWVWRLWTWALLHDTVPRDATARRRERSIARQHRHDQRATDRQYRKEEYAKAREKKDEEERQAYSVYFE